MEKRIYRIWVSDYAKAMKIAGSLESQGMYYGAGWAPDIDEWESGEYAISMLDEHTEIQILKEGF